ncbi:hypothetical protein N7462_008022 [Penicillium macrosclerotiorum]|uniref:uncharacterized protein n=1 Tax=Penicillium macrosclerotiorum TaxID=303699 RepID=UPI0025471484|nr:uncharacterized protein N7462_008022 [Penicillium macrosclerotiorum]KAJ5679778.1 hypothetical protein N7462_008022 [Penicillium macrosclerotiorum]
MIAALVDPAQIDLTQEERYYLDFFRRNTSKQVASFFKGTFWDHLIHQVGESQPAVRHAAIGLGATHWNCETTENRMLPLQQCNKAIRHVRQLLLTGSPDRIQLETVLCACLVLGATSMIQGDAQGSSYHLTSGLKLLDQWQGISSDKSALGALLLQTFTQNQLGWISLTNNGDAYPNMTLPDVIGGQFPVVKTLDSAEESIGFVVAIGWLSLQVKTQPEICHETKRKGIAVTLLDKLHAWTKQIEGLKGVQADRSQVKRLILFLKIWIEVLLIRISTDERLGEGETRYDDRLPSFQQVIQLSKELLSHANHEIWVWITTPLVFCALKCRHWHTRHEALRLLKIWPTSEGIWSMSNTALVISRMVQKESEGFGVQDTIPESSRIDSLRAEFLSGTPRVKVTYQRSQLQADTSSSRKQEGSEQVIIFY